MFRVPQGNRNSDLPAAEVPAMPMVVMANDFVAQNINFVGDFGPLGEAPRIVQEFILLAHFSLVRILD